MADLARAEPELPWFTADLQAELIEAGKNGMKTEWVARYCGVAPHALANILDMGARRDASERFRSFFMRWTRVRVELMKRLHDEWIQFGNTASHTMLVALFPQVYGKDAKPDHDPFARAVSHEEELQQLDAIIDNPGAYGDDIFELFRKHKRLRPDGT